jgi:hypothetical protein
MSEKKVVRRSVTIALGIICVILTVGIVGAIANYTSVISGKDNTISSRDSQISNLQTQNKQVQTWLDGNETYYANEIVGKDLQITNLQDQIATKDSQITNLQSIVDLQKQEVVVSQSPVNQGAGESSTVVGRSYPYSGYLRISSTSTTSNAYITLQYWFGGKLYTFSQIVGTSGEILFAILKTDSATVYVGNHNYGTGASHTITITYCY